jgi:hypothetical protein
VAEVPAAHVAQPPPEPPPAETLDELLETRSIDVGVQVEEPPRRRRRGGGAAGAGGPGQAPEEPAPGDIDPEDLNQATATAADELAADHATSRVAREAARRQVPEEAPSWSEDPSAFQAAYDAARARRSRGEPAVPYLTEGATGGLGSAAGGRAFGVEIEFDLDAGVDRSAVLRAIGEELHRAGLTSSPEQRGYHARPSESSAGLWRFERDATVAGEIVSPVLHDDPATWRQLAQVCEIISRHGGRATGRTGGHVHVGLADYDHDVDNHNSLLGLFAAHEDALYRLAQNPARRSHRGLAWCRPNIVPAEPFRDVASVRRRNEGHGLGLNFESVAGYRSDHVEFRMWDSSLDPGVIQAQVKLSLGLTQAAFSSPRRSWGPREAVGTHRSANTQHGPRRRLRGEAWRADTASFRQLVDRVFTRDVDREQATALFAVTRWQRLT